MFNLWSICILCILSSAERPLHYKEVLQDVILKWCRWSTDFSRNNFLCFKRNYIQENIENIVCFFSPNINIFIIIKNYVYM